MGGVERSILDILLKIEENKQKYLCMLNTKFFLDEEEVGGLSYGSKKLVQVICPFCQKIKMQGFKDANKAGHTLCSNCSRTLQANINFLGTKHNRLLIYDFATFGKNGKNKCIMVRAICDCGVEKVFSLSSIRKGNTKSCGCIRVEMLKEKVGELNPSWNSELTDEDRIRTRNKTGPWTKAVKKRDGFTCQVCGATEHLIAHHLNSYAKNKELRYDIENGITLCRDCHTDFHVNFMGTYRVPCTSEDFEEYLVQV
jgi:transcription elongation factor Elf1